MEGNRHGRTQGGRAKRRKVCFFTANGITRIDYKDVDLLKRFVSERGKILPRRNRNKRKIPTQTYSCN